MNEGEAVKTEEVTMQQEDIFAEKDTKKIVQYIGPTIPKVAVTSTVYSNGIPSELQEEIKNCRAINSLIVPLEKLVKARKELEQKDSALCLCYEKAEQYIRQKGE